MSYRYRQSGRRIIDQQREQWRDTPEQQAQRHAHNLRVVAVRAELARLFPEGVTIENASTYCDVQEHLLRRADATSPLFNANDPLWK